MTEEEWLGATDPTPMLEFIKSKATKRRLRLLGCASLRRVAHLLIDDRARNAIGTAERFADGLASEAELKKARMAANRAKYPDLNESGLGNAGYYLQCIACEIARADRVYRPAIVCDFAVSTVRESGSDRKKVRVAQVKRENVAQVEIVREIFGNPFRPVAFSPAWRTGTALSLAQQMYESRDFGSMPILADALQDAGCDSEEILNHCRDANTTHVRGCWVVDLVLGKE
jgi:hypothetical protein